MRRLYDALARWSLILLCFVHTCGLAADVLEQTNQIPIEAQSDATAPGFVGSDPADPSFEDDFSPMLFAMVVVFLAVCFLGLVLLIFALLVLAGLIAGGIVSASVVTGVFQRSVSSGFRALFLQVGAVLGLIAGAAGAMIFIWLAKIPSDSLAPWIIGLLAGLVWGLLSACLFNFAWGRVVDWISAKVQRRKTELPESFPKS